MNEGDQFVDLVVDKSRPDLVEQEKLRIEHQSARDLEPLATQQRQVSRGAVAGPGKAGLFQNFVGSGRSLAPRHQWRFREERNLQVLAHAHIEKRPRQLVGASDPQPRPFRRGNLRNVVAVVDDLP